ncbi:serine/threonine-protein kinase phg2 [Drosophila montana]|uniref:serine/threonine-protein kinase phg2 n=1 Tax=Drosophila montana TaxID=40370 RepID=UPI00313BB8AE
MKNLLVPLNGASGEPSNNCNFHKDALLGFAIELPDEQLDSAVIQLQAAAAEQKQNNNNKNNNGSSNNNNISNNNNNHHNNSNSGDYHQSLLNCVDFLPTAVAPPHLSECYQFDADAAASELVNVANKDCDSLAKLAYNLYRLAKEDHIVIDRKRNEVVRTDAVTHQKTIYRCMDPVGMGMQPPQSSRSAATTTSLRANRSRKRTAPAGTAIPTKAPLTIAAPSETATKATNEPIPASDADTMLRTRSGRIIRAALPQPATAAPNSAQMLQLLVTELRDKDYRAPAKAAEPAEMPAIEMAVQRERAVPPNAICPGCSKIFLGRRLQRHFVKYPEHMPSAIAVRQQQEQQQQQHQQHQQEEHAQPPQQQQQQQQLTQSYVPTLFGLLTAQLQRYGHLSEEQRADLFLHELNDFVEQLHLRSTRLIRNTSGLHFVNARTARVLGIPEGQYALDISAMESAQAPTPEPELQQLLHASTVPSARNLVDYPGLSMSLDDTLTDEAAQRLNLSAGGKLLPPSEESLLRNVGDLMQPPVAVAPPNVGEVAGAMLPHYDHASDNAVEALSMKETPNAAILDLNVDFFQFNNN